MSQCPPTHRRLQRYQLGSWMQGSGRLYQHEGVKHMTKRRRFVASCLEKASTFSIRVWSRSQSRALPLGKWGCLDAYLSRTGVGCIWVTVGGLLLASLGRGGVDADFDFIALALSGEKLEGVTRRGSDPGGRDKLGAPGGSLVPDDVEGMGGETGEPAERRGITRGRRGGPVYQESFIPAERASQRSGRTPFT